MVAAILLLLIGLGGLYVSIFVKSKALYSYLPDQIVIALAQRGTSEAIDEVAVRWSTSGEFNDEQQAGLISYALELQADRSRAWDPRWGQVLMDKIATQTLSDDQLSQFVMNGYNYKVILRHRIRHGEDSTPWTLMTIGDRVMTPLGGVMPYKHSVSIRAWGIVGQDPIREFELPRGARTMVLQGSETSDFWVRSTFRGAELFSTGQIGTDIELFVDIRVRLIDPNSGTAVVDKTIRQLSTIQIIARKDAVVDFVPLDSREIRLIEAITLSPVISTKFPNSGESNYRVELGSIHMVLSDLPAPIAMRVYIRAEGEETEFGSVASRTKPGGNYGHQIVWNADPSDREALEMALQKHARIIDIDAVDVIMRPEPDIAIENPEITEVIDVSLIFRGIPIRILADTDEVRTLWNEETNYLGEVFVEDRTSSDEEHAP